MSYSDTASAKRYASIAEVAAAQAKLSAEKLDNAPDYAAQAAADAAAAAISASTAASAESVVNGLAASASASATAAAASAEEAGNAAAAAVGQCLRVPAGESVDVLPAITDREDTFLTFGSDGNTSLLPKSDVAILDNDGKIPTSMIPAIAISQIFVVNSQSAMLALDAQNGDVAKRTDLGYSFILANEPASTLSNWVQLNDDVLAQLSQSTGASLIGYGSETLEDVADRVALKLNSADLAAAGGASLVGAPQGIGNLTNYLNKYFICLDGLPGIDPTGATDSSAGINAALATYSGTGTELYGNPNSVYLQESTVKIPSNITLNYNGGIVKDNVQGFIATSGGRANHTFQIYGATGVHLTGFRYQQVSTRANGVPTGAPNTSMIWVGGQYLGGSMTRDIKVTNIFNLENNACDDGFFLCGMGELDNILVEDIYLKGGNWNWGLNFEYGLAPEDPSVNPTMTNGRHPYNITVRNVRGENLTSCDGFLRVGGAYNVMFEQCTGYNVTNFIHYFSGDRGVSRFGQNVYYKNCKAKHDPNIVSIADNMVWIIVTDHDGSTGDPLPTWTNRYHEIIFDNCEFWNNGTLGGSCVRFVSNAGKTTFRNCTLKGGFYGVWSQPGGRATANPRYSLTLDNCVLQNCYQFIRLVDSQGVLVKHCTITGRQAGSSSENQVPGVVVSGDCAYTVFEDNLFSVPNSITSTNWFNNQSAGITLSRNRFETVSSSNEAVISTYPIFGRWNSTNGILISTAASSYRVVGESPYPKVLSASQTSVEFEKGGLWNSNTASTGSINQFLGGSTGDIIYFRGTASPSSVTFVHGDATVTDPTQRCYLKAGANQTVTGSTWAKSFVKMTNGWWEM